MIAATSRAEIQAILDRYRKFQECLLRGLRLGDNGLKLELEFEYIWEPADADVWRVSAEPTTIWMSLQPVEQALIKLSVPAGVIESPEGADWGLTEVAIVRVEEPPRLPGSVRTRRPRHKLVVAWERDQRIEAVFSQLQIEDRSMESTRES
jgi:hypothetical protein